MKMIDIRERLRLEQNPELERLVESLRRHGIAEEVIHSALADARSA